MRLWLGLVLAIGVAGCSTDPPSSAKVTPDRTGRIAGRVFDKGNGREIGGAFVSLDSGRQSIQTLTAADGSFLFDRVEAGSYRLASDASGFRPEMQNVTLSPRVALSVDVGLAAAADRGDLTALVLDATTGARLPGALLSIPSENLTTVSDSAGRFVARALDAGALTVEVRASGHALLTALVTVPAGGVALETFRLAANAGSVAGTAFSTSTVFATRALGGTLVRLLEPATTRPSGLAISLAAQTTSPLSFVDTGIVTRTAADGRFRLDNVTTGRIGLLFSSESHDDLLATTAVVLGRTSPLTVRLRFNRASVRGRVTDTAGGAVKGALVSVGEQGLTTATDGLGRYDFGQQVIVRDFPRIVNVRTAFIVRSFPVATVPPFIIPNPIADSVTAPVFLPAHQTSIGTLASGFDPGSALISLVAGGTVTLDFVLARATGNLFGQVVRARDRVAVPGSVVSLTQLGLTTPTDSAGGFAFGRLPAAFLRVNADAIGFSRATTFVSILPGQNSFVEVRLVAPGSLSGTIRRRAGSTPISGARVVLPALSRLSLTDTAGRYAFGELPAGTLQIDVTAQGAVPLTTSTPISDGQAAVLDLTLQP